MSEAIGIIIPARDAAARVGLVLRDWSEHFRRIAHFLEGPIDKLEIRYAHFVARHLGYDARLYDGSIVDWTRRKLPAVMGK